jgi:hypothetical protein
MAALSAVRAGVLSALRGAPDLTGLRVLDEPGKAAVPFVQLRDLTASDWGTKDRAGREVRVGVTVRDMGDLPARAEALGRAAEAALLALPRDLDGWRVASVVPTRSAMVSEGERRWAALVDVRVRMLED